MPERTRASIPSLYFFSRAVHNARWADYGPAAWDQNLNEHSATPSYHPVSRMLHWLVAGMIVVQFVLAKLAERAEHADQTVRELGLLANHKSVGITILALAVVRLAWRVVQRPPGLPVTMPRWQITASAISHWTMYVLLFALPLSGWLMSSASAYTVSWFGLISLPDLVGADPQSKEIFEEIHEVLAKLLFVVAAVHILAALKHAFKDKDGVMQRMTSITGVLLFVVVIAAGVSALGRAGSAPSAGDPVAAVARDEGLLPAADSAVMPGKVSRLPLWEIDHNASFIRFTADQAGADVTGQWTSWQARLQFAEDDLPASQFEVTIDTAAVETRDAERDATLADADWFDVANYPTARYQAADFQQQVDGGFVARVADGKRRGVSRRFEIYSDHAGWPAYVKRPGPWPAAARQCATGSAQVKAGSG